MDKELLVFGDKEFKIKVPEDAKITFGPFSPPPGKGMSQDWRNSSKAEGTLRIYKGTKDNIIAVFAGVRGFRDLSLDYTEKVAVEEGASVWKSDNDGYSREEKVSRKNQWIEPPAIPAKTKK